MTFKPKCKCKTGLTSGFRFKKYIKLCFVSEQSGIRDIWDSKEIQFEYIT